MSIFRALQRCRIPILTVALTYGISVMAGMVMVHSGNVFAVDYRDRVVGQARSSPVIVALNRNDRLRAAGLDFAGNLYAAAVDTVGGVAVVVPYPLVAYRGWIGGIVSINSTHASRLADPTEAAYYLITLILQLIPYSLAGGAGVNIGLAILRPKLYYAGRQWLGIPVAAVRDALRVYLLVVPLFLIASLWEFLAR